MILKSLFKRNKTQAVTNEVLQQRVMLYGLIATSKVVPVAIACKASEYQRLAIFEKNFQYAPVSLEQNLLNLLNSRLQRQQEYWIGIKIDAQYEEWVHEAAQLILDDLPHSVPLLLR